MIHILLFWRLSFMRTHTWYDIFREWIIHEYWFSDKLNYANLPYRRREFTDSFGPNDMIIWFSICEYLRSIWRWSIFPLYQFMTKYMIFYLKDYQLSMIRIINVSPLIEIVDSLPDCDRVQIIKDIDRYAFSTIMTDEKFITDVVRWISTLSYPIFRRIEEPVAQSFHFGTDSLILIIDCISRFPTYDWKNYDWFHWKEAKTQHFERADEIIKLIK